MVREKRGKDGRKRGIRMEAVIGDTQQEGCLLSLKEEKREVEEGG